MARGIFKLNCQLVKQPMPRGFWLKRWWWNCHSAKDIVFCPASPFQATQPRLKLMKAADFSQDPGSNRFSKCWPNWSCGISKPRGIGFDWKQCSWKVNHPGTWQQALPEQKKLRRKIQQSAIEQSNVNVVEEITRLITAQRSYEMNSNVISTTDEMLNTVNQLR